MLLAMAQIQGVVVKGKHGEYAGAERTPQPKHVEEILKVQGNIRWLLYRQLVKHIYVPQLMI